MLDLFIRKEVTYDLRVKDLLQLPTAGTVLNGFNSIVFRGSILWNAISDEIKSSKSIASFKRKIKSWNGDARLMPFRPLIPCVPWSRGTNNITLK